MTAQISKETSEPGRLSSRSVSARERVLRLCSIPREVGEPQWVEILARAIITRLLLSGASSSEHQAPLTFLEPSEFGDELFASL